MIYQKTPLLFYFLLITFSAFSQNTPNSIKVETIDLKDGAPLYNHENAIIGRLERIIDTTKKSAYIDIYGPLITKTKITTFSGKEMILDLLPRKTIFIEEANRIITYGQTHSSCDVNQMVDIIVYNNLGTKLFHLKSIEFFSLDISSDGTIYLADSDHLIKLNTDGSSWKKELPVKLNSFRSPIVKKSFNTKEIAVIQYDGYITTTIFIFDNNGSLINSIAPRNYGFNRLHFWDSKKIINFDHDLFCFQSIDYKNEESNEIFHCFDKLIFNKGTFKFLGFYKKDYFALHLKDQNEIVILNFQNDEFSILKKYELGKDLLKKVKSTVFSKNRLELYTLEKKITLMIN